MDLVHGPIPRRGARVAARLRWSATHMEGPAIVLVLGWGLVAVATSLAGVAGTSGPLYWFWGTVFAAQGFLHGAAVLSGARRWPARQAIVGCTICLFHTFYYLLYATVGGHPTGLGGAVIFGVLAWMKARAYIERSRRGGPDG